VAFPMRTETLVDIREARLVQARYRVSAV